MQKIRYVVEYVESVFGVYRFLIGIDFDSNQEIIRMRDNYEII